MSIYAAQSKADMTQTQSYERNISETTHLVTSFWNHEPQADTPLVCL